MDTEIEIKNKKSFWKRFLSTLLTALLFFPKQIAKIFKKFSAWFNYNVTAKMTMINTVIFTFFGTVLSILIIFITEQSVLTPHISELKHYYSYIASDLYKEYDQEVLASKAPELKAANIEAAILSQDNELLWTNLSSTSKNYSLLLNTPLNKKVITETKIMYYAGEVKDNSGNTYKIYLGRHIDSDYYLLIRLKTAVYTIIPLCLVVQLIVGILSGGVLLSPIRKIINQTRKITRDNLSTARLDEGKATGELKELIQVLNQMLDNLQESFEAQERFVSDASHELKTPIAVLQGYSDMLKRWGKKDEAVLDEAVDAIFKETQHMKNLVEMLLFLARTNNKTANLKIENFFLNDLLEEIMKDTQRTCNNRILSTGKMMAFTIDADRELIKQLIRILIDNAIKYTSDNGEIKLSCYTDGEYAYVVVQDNGIGISKQDLPHIFERFYRADKARSRGTGSGLGLSIAKKIADVHNAEILISSEPGVGTVVNLKLNLNNDQNSVSQQLIK
ncbi:MAG TPA: HAMP domain-containing sensor histidine kinase [Clostridia bacterium]